MVVLAQTRKLDLHEVLSYILGPIPWSIASLDGGLTKTVKSVLQKIIEEGTPCLNILPQASACIIDAMAMIQAVASPPATFADLAEMLLDKLISYAGSASRIDFVGDEYPEVSIKNI